MDKDFELIEINPVEPSPTGGDGICCDLLCINIVCCTVGTICVDYPNAWICYERAGELRE